jgi:membrane protein YqaA with SNARE-associated domain
MMEDETTVIAGEHPGRVRSVIVSTDWWVRWMLRRWEFRVGLAILAGGLAFFLFYPGGSRLIPFMLFSIPSNSLIMIPHEPALLATVQVLRRSMGVFEASFLIAIAGCLGAVVACIIDQLILRWVFSRRKAQSYLDRPAAQRVLRWFRVSPFATITVFALTPLPFFLVRFISAAVRYPLTKYALATVFGRFWRFFILAFIGGWWMLPNWVVWVLLGVVIVTTFYAQRRFSRSPLAEVDSEGETVSLDTDGPPI